MKYRSIPSESFWQFIFHVLIIYYQSIYNQQWIEMSSSHQMLCLFVIKSHALVHSDFRSCLFSVHIFITGDREKELLDFRLRLFYCQYVWAFYKHIHSNDWMKECIHGQPKMNRSNHRTQSIRHDFFHLHSVFSCWTSDTARFACTNRM